MMHWSQNAWSVMTETHSENIITVLCSTTFSHRIMHIYLVLFSSTFAHRRMNLCTTVTESDVARGKNALKASLVGQLNGT